MSTLLLLPFESLLAQRAVKGELVTVDVFMHSYISDVRVRVIAVVTLYFFVVMCYQVSIQF